MHALCSAGAPLRPGTPSRARTILQSNDDPDIQNVHISCKNRSKRTQDCSILSDH